MDEKNIEIVLVYMKYDHGTKTWKLCAEADPSDYPPSVKAGPWSDGGEILTLTHLQAKIHDEYQNVDIALKMTAEQARLVETVTTEPRGYLYERYPDPEKGLTYFAPPRQGIGHYTASGSETIQILFTDGRKEQMTLTARIAEDEKDFYRELVFDLISMDQQLCMDDKSPMSMAIEWSKNLYDQTEKLVDRTYRAFSLLEKKAVPELKPFRTKTSFRKIKKMTSRALIEHEIFHKDKVSAISYREDLDTFEHRVIKTHLRRLRELVQIRQEMEFLALKDYRSRLQARLHFSKEERIDNPELLPVYIQFRVVDIPRSAANGQGILDLNKQEQKLSVKTHHPNGTPVTDTDGCRFQVMNNGVWSGWMDYAKDVHISVPLTCTETAAILFHYLQSDYRVISKNCIVGIHGGIPAKKRYRSINARGDARFDFDLRRIDRVSLFVQGKEHIKYQAAQTDDSEKRQMIEHFEAHTCDQGEDLGAHLADLHKIDQLEDLDRYEQQIALEPRWTALRKNLAEMEESPLMQAVSPVYTPIQTSNLFAFHPAYENMYAVMQADDPQMQGTDYLPEDPGDGFSVTSLSRLYERWSCLALVKIFIQDYGFQLRDVQTDDAGVDDLSKYIHRVLRDGKLNGTRFCLQGDVCGKQMDVTIWYDRKFFLDQQAAGPYLISKKDHLRPDITMQIRRDGKTQNFILDSKYRGRQNPNGRNSRCDREIKISGLVPYLCTDCKTRCYDGIQDLCETAFQKYTLELSHGIREKDIQTIDGSFIIHSCADTIKPPGTLLDDKITVQYDPKNYLGACPDALAQRFWKERCEAEKWAVRTDCLTAWAQWTNEKDHENRLGIVTANPRINNLTYLLQMIMEHHFGLYRDRCWLCGHPYGPEDIKKKYTKRNFFKYHIECPACHHFKVETHCGDCHQELGKHQPRDKQQVNYLAQQKSKKDQKTDACWNVCCPRCRNLAR